MKKALLFLFLYTTYLIGNAAAVSFTAKTSSNTIEVGERVQITFSVNSSGGNFTPPAFPKLKLLSGPNQSQSMQYVNGSMSRSTSISYVLVATEKGTIKIGAAKIKVSGKVYETQPFEIKVVDASANSGNAQRNRQDQRKSGGQDLKDFVYIKAITDKREAYVGEKVTVTYKLYSKLTIAGVTLESLPALNGFWSQDLKSIYDQLEVTREQINGEAFQVINLQQSILYPQRSGELTVDPLSMKVTVQMKTRRSRSVFEQMFGSYENKEIIASSNPIKVKAKALPNKGKPSDFSGAVGSFTMKMKTNKDSIQANQAIDVSVEINGTGNLPLIGAPDLNFPPDFEVYDPETKDNFKTTYNGSQGSKKFDYLVIPRHSGSFNLQPFNFSYFDLKSKNYKTISSKPIEIIVTKGSEEENVIYNANRKEEVELLNTDIRYIHLNNLSLLSSEDLFYNSTLFYGLLLLSLLSFIAVYFISKTVKVKTADKIGLRKSKANKLAKKRMSKAKKHLDQGESKLFFEEISAALYGYFADKFNITVADLSQEKILQLIDNNIDTEAIASDVKSVLEDAEMARFAPSSQVDSNGLYNKSIEIIRKVEEVES